MAALRDRFPQLTVAQLYDHPRLGSLAEFLDGPAATQWTPGQRTLVYSAEPRITRGDGAGHYQIQVEVDSEIDEYGLRTIAPPGTTNAGTWAIAYRTR